MVGQEAIPSLIHSIWLSFSWTCGTVHFFGEIALFLFHLGSFFRNFFLQTHQYWWWLIKRYWWFFLSQGNRSTKYRAHPKIRRPIPYQLTFAFLVALHGFHPLLSTQLTADLTLKCSDGSMFHPLSHTAWKNPFYCANKALNSALSGRHVVVFDRLWANKVPISNRAFSYSNVYAKWLIHCLLITLKCQLSCETSIHDHPKPFCGLLYVFSNNCQI